MRAALPFIFALAGGICLPAVYECVCVYTCTICNWVLFFNCFLRQKLLFTWQILAQVLAYATPTHKEKAASQAATVLVGCHAHPRQGLLSIPLSHSQPHAVCRKFCCIKVFVMLRCRFLALHAWVHKICHVCYFCDESSSRVRIEVGCSWSRKRIGRGGESAELELRSVWLGLFTQLILITFVYMQRFWNRN